MKYGAYTFSPANKPPDSVGATWQLPNKTRAKPSESMWLPSRQIIDLTLCGQLIEQWARGNRLSRLRLVWSFQPAGQWATMDSRSSRNHGQFLG